MVENVLLSQEVRALSEEICAEESRYHYITMMRSILEKQLEHVNTEMKLYVSTAADKKKSIRSYLFTTEVLLLLRLCASGFKDINKIIMMVIILYYCPCVHCFDCVSCVPGRASDKQQILLR